MSKSYASKEEYEAEIERKKRIKKGKVDIKKKEEKKLVNMYRTKK